jgi:glutamate synthase (NADPH) large chain
MNTNIASGLYRSEFEHDACGVGFVAHLKGNKSHQIIKDALSMLTRMDHRGARGYEYNSGDGAGILLQIPHEFLFEECLALGFRLPQPLYYAAGLVFFPVDKTAREACKQILLRKLDQLGLELLGYRPVPVNASQLGQVALKAEPNMEQIFIKRPLQVTDEAAFERKLFVFRKYASRIIHETVEGAATSFYFASLSCRTLVYKGQLATDQVEGYFPDLQDGRAVSALALVHSRFSTNTFPSWKLAQPFRYIAHNGEINTVRGNVNWMRSREVLLQSDLYTAEEIGMILPVCDANQSDSANLDNVIELLLLSGRSLPHVMMMLIPEAWDGHEAMEPGLKAFYEYHASIMEPWDGPASITFTDGKMVGAMLDRNGLRPSRYLLTNDDRIIMASEAGVVDVDPANVVLKGRLQPGRMFVADLEQGRIISDPEIKHLVSSQKPYAQWLENCKIHLSQLPKPQADYHQPDAETLLKRQLAFGFTTEDIKTILMPMANSGKEALGSMGNDTPLAVLSQQSQHLSSYFKQLFAQVTNPPIDPIRERLVMSLNSFVGGEGNILSDELRDCSTLQLAQPVLSNTQLAKIRFIDHEHFQTKTVNIFFKADPKPGALERAIRRVCQYASDAVEDGFSIILLSDRSMDSDHAPIPSLLATAAVHHHLIRKGLRGKVGIIVEGGDIWETHHIATLLGYGASGVNPYMAFDTLSQVHQEYPDPEYTEEKLHQNYIKAVGGELLKIFAKMGISTLSSYQGAQVFEIIGLNKEVVSEFFTGSISRIEGLCLDDIAREVLSKHTIAYKPASAEPRSLKAGGVYQWRANSEHHLFNPQTIHLLQQATRTGNYETYKKYAALVQEQSKQASTLRGLLDFAASTPIPIEQVEPVEDILKRFATGAMSFGSISHEAHSTLAIAMNRIGGKSNSGEGGEDESRFEPKPNGDWERSAIKQVASGRFGVTSYYLTNAEELQIKMAQGAKPGEGGQLPGHKVDEWIGKVRHSTPGVGLISPPPHHDIYSIEDLAQLIFDLKNANPAARISVKLVSEAGVGTVAAGVAKAHADVVLISGHDGGTGASPLSSIRHAGLPWELGLAETHQTLVKNKLRGRITVQADGQMKTGKDIAVAALLGAEEFGVATAALVSAGCIMMRKCHLNTCPVGIATQRPELRALFSGEPEHIINLFRFMAQELREIMAQLGIRTLNEMVGQSQYLKVATLNGHWKYKGLDLSPLLYKEPMQLDTPLYKQHEQDHGLEAVLDQQLIETASLALELQKEVKADFKITNCDRAVGTMLSHEISKRYKGQGLPADTIHYKFKGSAGQSFGAFAAPGITFELEGEANDYFGKGLSGAELRLYPSKRSRFDPATNSIAGNVALYGATAGEAFIRGQAGERFAVRNSGANAVVEGIGDHGCEYMTGGIVVVLGATGRNFAAGMSGGIAYVWDENRTLESRCNTEMIMFDTIDIEDELQLYALIDKHQRVTGSTQAAYLLRHWKEALYKFKKVMPIDYKAVLERNKSKQVREVAVKSVIANG